MLNKNQTFPKNEEQIPNIFFQQMKKLSLESKKIKK